jgi:hypothetical protein
VTFVFGLKSSCVSEAKPLKEFVGTLARNKEEDVTALATPNEGSST